MNRIQMFDAMTPEQRESLRDDALREGARLATKLFDKRSHGGGRRVEVHINEATLAAFAAVAFELGFASAFSKGKRNGA